MPHITVDDSQAEVILGAGEGIEVRDRNGKHLGFISHTSAPENGSNGEFNQEPSGLGSLIANRFRGIGLDQEIQEWRGYPATPPELGK